ncbi:tRNA (N6-threonylcarbamoyladenosine(37)-N6)-methyltransferase TrmO [Deinococcus apachensis]|uniref:tRNA (N6-threonylcarbamoyladenosine(37)-N6)-methyltransferase TrmO n=1 Tax=Deinococcus apachensis TaxID=309886 RepID=UPI0003671139|nr:tRNA (N6-threonylcarbamoyladenosine(37)-N6)-methyltransferase TrmO [Deinococcus apachensis]
MTLHVIGTVHSPIQEGVDTDWGRVESTVELRPDLESALQSLNAFSHVLIVFYMHESTFSPEDLVRHPQGRIHLPRVGIFAQRAKHRPNPIGITAVELLGVDGHRLRVRGLDAIHGTPVLDVKPYFPWFDRRDQVRTPEWCDELMRTYF